MLKTEQEIRDQIGELEARTEELQRIRKSGEMPEADGLFKQYIRENWMMTCTLKWVLGEADRYD